MLRRRIFLRVVGPTVLMGLVLLGSCGLGAAYLHRVLDRTIGVLSENVESRRVARILGEELEDLALALDDRDLDRIPRIRERIEEDAARARALANTEEERRLVGTFDDALRALDEEWEGAVGVDPEAARPVAAAEVLRHLMHELAPALRDLRSYNGTRVEGSLADHRRAVGLTAWGLLALGAIGTTAGLLLGFAAARGLSLSVQRLSIQIRDAAGRLGYEEPPAIEIRGELADLGEQMRAVVAEIEAVLERLRQREREVLRSEQMATFGRIAAGIAHEMRNPLTSVTALIQANREDAERAGLPGDDLQVIEGQLRAMEERLQSLLDFGRLPSPEPARVDLAELAGRALRLLAGQARQAGVRLSFAPPAGPVAVEADAGQVQQILVNLTRNALDATPSGGRVIITLGQTPKGLAELAVEDNGPGIAPGVREQIFDPFVSSKPRGLGLGLAVSRRIAEAHGGTLTADDRAHGGARFVLRLPATAAADGPTADRPTTEEPR